MADTRTPVAAPRQQYINLDLVRHVMQHRLLSGASRWILFTIASHADARQRQCFCSLDTLARESGWSRRSVMQHIARLQRAGYLCMVGTHHSGTCIYQVQLDRLLSAGAGAPHAAPAAAASAPESAPVPAPAPAPEPVPTPAPPPPEAKPAHPPRENCPTPVQDLPAPGAEIAPKEGFEKGLEQPREEEGARINADTIGQLNAQRRRNGKDPLARRDIVQLGTEAAKAGITPLEAAQWVLASPKRNFFKADFYVPPAFATPAPPSPAAVAAACVMARLQPPPAVLTPGEQAAQAQAARQAREHLRQYVACNATSAPPSTAPQRNTRWAQHAIELFVAGQPVSRYRLHTACQVLGIHPGSLRPSAGHVTASA